MIKSPWIFIAIAILALLSGCSTPRTIEMPVYTEEILLDTLEVVATRITEENKYDLPAYRATTDRPFDLLHTRLDLSFNMNEQTVIGKANLTLTPLFYDQDTLVLDAKNFEIKSITVNDETVDYLYDQSLLEIPLENTANTDDTLEVFINYIAHPTRSVHIVSGAITSDQGLFFIDPLDEDPNKPTQIWTQGETEFNSRWFPTIDKPNERCTQEMYLTVENKMRTLSNGLLISSSDNKNGTRTDYWRMDLPHAPYLFALAIGQFAKVEEMYKDIPLQYYVDEEYAASAKEIFAHTPEMIKLFEDLFDMDYPWSKYAQVAVTDFVSGAMENTTAVIFGDFVQIHKEDMLRPGPNDYIVAHELIHHWFGDLVTCESWSHLTLNEGFANYGEYLWFEHKYGKDEADYSRIMELMGYLEESSFHTHPLIHFQYEDKENMFDAHSYNKGGLVLHLLRSIVGDEAFFKSTGLYLKRHAFSSVEVHDLRLAFEEVTGRDLTNFFNQWFLSPGHPVLDIEKEYLSEQGTLKITVSQTQEPEVSLPVFQFPLGVDIFLPSGEKVSRKFQINKRKQILQLEVSQEPELVLIDPDNVLPGFVKDPKTGPEMKVQLAHQNNLRYRAEAMEYFNRYKEELREREVALALADPHWSIRRAMLDQINLERFPQFTDHIVSITTNDTDARVQLAGFRALSQNERPEAIDVAEKILEKNNQAPIVYEAINVLRSVKPEKAFKALNRFNDVRSSAIKAGRASLLAVKGGAGDLDFFRKNLATLGFDYMEPFLDYYGEFLVRQDAVTIDEGLNAIYNYCTSDVNVYLKYYAINALLQWSQEWPSLSDNASEAAESILPRVREVLSDDQNETIKDIFSSWLEDDN